MWGFTSIFSLDLGVGRGTLNIEGRTAHSQIISHCYLCLLFICVWSWVRKGKRTISWVINQRLVNFSQVSFPTVSILYLKMNSSVECSLLLFFPQYKAIATFFLIFPFGALLCFLTLLSWIYHIPTFGASSCGKENRQYLIRLLCSWLEASRSVLSKKGRNRYGNSLR